MFPGRGAESVRQTERLCERWVSRHVMPDLYHIPLKPTAVLSVQPDAASAQKPLFHTDLLLPETSRCLCLAWGYQLWFGASVTITRGSFWADRPSPKSWFSIYKHVCSSNHEAVSAKQTPESLTRVTKGQNGGGCSPFAKTKGAWGQGGWAAWGAKKELGWLLKEKYTERRLKVCFKEAEGDVM